MNRKAGEFLIKAASNLGLPEAGPAFLFTHLQQNNPLSFFSRSAIVSAFFPILQIQTRLLPL
jgi:hypothetical protein